MTNRKIDADTVKALEIVRAAMRGAYRIAPEVCQALTDLDNADVFAEVDEVDDMLAVNVRIAEEVIDWLTSDHARFVRVVDAAWNPETFAATVAQLYAEDKGFHPDSGEFASSDVDALRQMVIAEVQRRDPS